MSRIVRVLALIVAAAALGAEAQSAQRMADHIEMMIHVKRVQGHCAACSAVVESLYKVIAAGEGHHINDAATLLPQIFDTATRGFSYNAELDQWDRLDEPAEVPEEHMHNYIVDHVISSHAMMTVLAPYYLQNERHHLHRVLCVELLKHCEEAFEVDMHHEDIHEDYDLHKYRRRFGPDHEIDEL